MGEDNRGDFQQGGDGEEYFQMLPCGMGRSLEQGEKGAEAPRIVLCRFECSLSLGGHRLYFFHFFSIRNHIFLSVLSGNFTRLYNSQSELFTPFPGKFKTRVARVPEDQGTKQQQPNTTGKGLSVSKAAPLS